MRSRLLRFPPGLGSWSAGRPANAWSRRRNWRRVLVIPGHGARLGCQVNEYGSPRWITQFKRGRDRDMRQAAARKLSDISLAHPDESVALYLVHEQVEWYGKTVWQAVRIRREGEE